MLNTIIINTDIQLTIDVVFESRVDVTKLTLCITSITIATHKITRADSGVILAKYA